MGNLQFLFKIAGNPVGVNDKIIRGMMLENEHHLNEQSVLRWHVEELTESKTLRKEVLNDTFTKYHIDGLPFEAALHHFTGCNPNEDPHDHPWGFTSHVLTGGYVEEYFHIEKSGWSVHTVSRNAGTVHHLPANWIHRIVMLQYSECWTLVLPYLKAKESGFYRFEDGGQILHRFWNETDFKPYKP